MSVSVDTPDSVLDPYVQLRNAADSSLTSSNDEGPDYDAFISHYTIASSGTYYVVVGKNYYSSTPGSYQLRIDVVRGIQLETDASYSNDSVSGANQLTLAAVGNRSEATVVGTVMALEVASANKDEDLFGWGTINTGNTVELSIRLPSISTLSPKVSLVNSAGVAVADEDGNTSDGHFLGTIASDGAYYAKVEANSGEGTRGQYLLDVVVADLVAPRVVSVDLPAEGATSSQVINSFNVTVSEDLDASTVNALSRLVLEYNGHYYTLTDTAMTWTQAESYAQTLGGHLVTINDQAEQEWVTDRFGWAYPWIGLTEQATEGTWVWVSGEPVTYTNWASGEPYNNYGNDDYARMYTNGKWYDREAVYTARGLIELTGVDTDGDKLPDVLDPLPDDASNGWAQCRQLCVSMHVHLM